MRCKTGAAQATVSTVAGYARGAAEWCSGNQVVDSGLVASACALSGPSKSTVGGSAEFGQVSTITSSSSLSAGFSKSCADLNRESTLFPRSLADLDRAKWPFGLEEEVNLRGGGRSVV